MSNKKLVKNSINKKQFFKEKKHEKTIIVK